MRQHQGKKHASQLEWPFLPPGLDYLLQPEQSTRLGTEDEVWQRPHEAKRPQLKPKARRRRQQRFCDGLPQGHNGQESTEHHRLTEANVSQFEGMCMKDLDYRDQPALTARIVQEQQEEVQEKQQTAEHEMRVWDAKWKHLRYQSTFLEPEMNSGLGDLSPRASSDPGSEGPRSCSFNNSRCNSVSINSCSSDTTDGHDVIGSGYLLRRSEPEFDKLNQVGPAISKQCLRERIKQTSEEIVEEVHMRRLNMALTAIEEIPELVEEVLQRNAATLADNVQAELDIMRDNMRELHVTEELAKVAQAEVAVTAIESIPDIIQTCFEARTETAKELVRTRMEEVAKTAQVVEVNSSESFREEVVQQMRCIPAEVKEITDKTIAKAVRESKMHASEKFKVAMEALASQATLRPEETLIEHTRKQIVNTDWTPKVRPVLDAAKAAAEQVVDIMQGTEEVKEQVTNQVVAETLLQAKVVKMAPRAKPQREELGANCEKPIRGAVKPTNASAPRNPGSIGHPELCPRPCLYFMEGACANGSACKFCHLSHPKRPAHLDKRHREMVRDMPYSQCFGFILPILKEKLQEMSFGEREMSMLQELATVPADDDFFEVGSAWSDEARAKNMRSLTVALKALSVRSLLMTLHRAGQAEGFETRADRVNAVEAMIQHLRLGGSQSSGLEN